MSFWPKKITMQEVFINSLGSLIAWLIWSIVIAVIIFLLSSILDVVWEFSKSERGAWTASNMLPLVLSVVTLIWTMITMFLTYYLLTITNSERYKKSTVIIWQIAFFSILLYIFITPIYIYLWLIVPEYIMYVFLFHVILLAFWTSILLELLNNYRYILIGIYWSFIWLFISTILTVIVFFSFTSWFAKLISLVVLLPLINASITFFKQLFELTYYHYFKYTSLDQIWDIFYQIELDEREVLREIEEKNIL